MIRSEITDQRFNFSHFYTTNYKDTIFRRMPTFLVGTSRNRYSLFRKPVPGHVCTADDGPDHPPFAVPAASEGPTATAHLTDKAALSQRRSPQRARRSEGPLRPSEGRLTSAEGHLMSAEGPLTPAGGPLTPTMGPLRPSEGRLTSVEGPLRPAEDPSTPSEGPLRPLRTL